MIVRQVGVSIGPFADASKIASCVYFIGIARLARFERKSVLDQDNRPPRPPRNGPGGSPCHATPARVDGNRADPERPQETSQLLLGQRTAVLPFGPRSLGVGDKLRYKVGGADDFVIAKADPDVLQEFDADGPVLRLAREEAGSPARLRRPVPPARSAMASSGRQLSAGAVVQPSGSCGSGSTSLSKLSAAQRAAWLRRAANSSLSRRHRRSTVAAGGLRWS